MSIKYHLRRRARTALFLCLVLAVVVFFRDIVYGTFVLTESLSYVKRVRHTENRRFNIVQVSKARAKDGHPRNKPTMPITSIGRLGVTRSLIKGPRFTDHVMETLLPDVEKIDVDPDEDPVQTLSVNFDSSFNDKLLSRGPYNLGHISNTTFPNCPRRRFRRILPECRWSSEGFPYPPSTGVRSRSQMRLTQLFNRIGLIYTPRDGSAVGAVRHGGMIPGDYDMDILIDAWTNEPLFRELGCYHDRYPMDMGDTWVWQEYLNANTWSCQCNWFKDLGPRELWPRKEKKKFRFSYFRNNTVSGEWELCRCIDNTSATTIPEVPTRVPWIRLLTCNVLTRYNILKKRIKQAITLHDYPMKMVDREPDNPLRHFSIHTFETKLPKNWPRNMKLDNGTCEVPMKTYKVDIKLNWAHNKELEGPSQYCRCKLDPGVEGICLRVLPGILNETYGQTWQNPLYSFESYLNDDGSSTDFDVKGICLHEQTRAIWGDGHCSGWNQ
eukprot:CFRG1128T1